MKPESICFDGTTITVRYPANPNARRGWWDAAVEHQFTYLPDLKSVESIIRLVAKSRKLKGEQHASLISIAKPVLCGSGSSLYIYESLIHRAGGRVRVGGKSPIYLLSPRGRKGTLVIGTSVYHKYNDKRFRIGLAKDWRWLPDLTIDEIGVETFTASRLDRSDNEHQ